MANRSKLQDKTPRTSKLVIATLLMSSCIGSIQAATQTSQAMSQAKMMSMVAKENLQVQVYDALEKMHHDEWAGEESVPT